MPKGYDAAVQGFSQRHGKTFDVHIDPRSGTPTNIIGSIPLIPGSGKGNHVTLKSISAALGETVTSIDRKVVAKLMKNLIRDSSAVLNLDQSQLGEVHVEKVSDHLLQIRAFEQVNGIKVRDARLVATISHGNVVLIGTEKWGNVHLDTTPKLTEKEALDQGFRYAEGQSPNDRMVAKATLEIVPVAPLELQEGDRFVGKPGQGYEHRLVWTFSFRRAPDPATWEVMIDAHSGEVISFQDTNKYATESAKGGVYPLTNTEVCPSNDKCGTMQPAEPMPFIDTGLPAPNNFTNSAGLFDFLSGTVSTTLSGKYVTIFDYCGAASEKAAGSITLGGQNGDHDCTSGGASSGNTPAARSSFYEINKIAEMARGYLPNNAWLKQALESDVNLAKTCNAYWDGHSVNFYKSGGGCRNTGEIAAVFDHEWGHGLDAYDGNGYSNPSESYADVAAIYRLQSSCVGYGFFQSYPQGCGVTVDGTGSNTNIAQDGAARCALDCSGVRETDWQKLAGPLNTPDTALNFVCKRCAGGGGPCGREVHCEAAIDGEAAWDFAVRELQAPPFSYDTNTAFLVANRIFYQGSGNIGNWHTCSCASSTSNGCGATNAYMQWLAADDDDGDITNGTPHMTALFNAFDRHGIACATPRPVNSGCAGAPSAAPTKVTAESRPGQVQLGWDAVPAAASYQVYRAEGFAGCDFGKTLIGTVAGNGTTAYTDQGLANGRQYCYTVMAAGSSAVCRGSASTCVCATPQLGPHGALRGTVTDGGTGNPISGALVKVGNYAETKTDPSGGYLVNDIVVGAYTVTASAFAHNPSPPVTVQIEDGITATSDFSLVSTAPPATVQGVVTDTQGGPLSARIDISAADFSQTVYSDKVTGKYAVTLYQGLPFTFTFTLAGYFTVTINVTPASATVSQDVTMTVRPEGPDLVIAAVTPPAYAVTGQAVTVPVTVFNQGNSATSSQFNVGLYLCSTGTISTSCTGLGTQGANLAAGAKQPLTFTATVPSVSPGTYYIGAIADTGNNVPEASETNNTLAGSPTVIGYGPDLVVTSVTPPANAVTGQSVTVPVTVKNVGTGATASQFLVGLYLCNTGTISTSCTSLGTLGANLVAGAEQSLTFSATVPSVPSGTYYIGAIADTGKNVSETDETNNTLAGSPTVIGYGADLVVTAVTPPASAVTGQRITVPVTVKNVGTAATVSQFLVGLYLCNTGTIGTGCTSLGTLGGNLAAGAEQSLNFSATVPSVTSGTYYIGATADTGKNVSESDETNNTRMGSSTVIGYGADLVVTAVTPPASAVTGQRITVPVTVKNVGTAATVSQFLVGLYLCNTGTISTGCTSLGTLGGNLVAGAEQSLNFTATVPSVTSGTYYIGAIADSGKNVSESDETNNTLAGSPTVIGYGPDLVVTAVTPPASAVTGQRITVPVTVKNVGAGATVSQFLVGLYLCNTDTISTSCTSLGTMGANLVAGAEQSLTFSATVPPVTSGPYYIGAIADTANNVLESTESNNILAGSPTVIGYGPDLVVTAVMPPASAVTGQRITVPVTVKNVGTGATVSPFLVGLYLCGTSTISTSCASLGQLGANLVAGAEQSLTFTVTVPSVNSGTYYIGAIADPASSIRESSEMNNTLPGSPTIVTKQ